ncbi:MAG: PaaI family thioesterase [Pirellulaceae bacterium]|jgi:uncharacterized protein (TIGR00369 family)|nr:PaaI family thioesterase [Pirellulaceae bacterium]
MMNRSDRDSLLFTLREQSHPGCFVCGSANTDGLGLAFHVVHDGAVEATFLCAPIFAGYPGMLHGGVISTLLDGAMTNCLFAHGIEAVTVDMHVRFRHPVVVSRAARVRAWKQSDGSPVYRLNAELSQGEQVVAVANARFVSKSLVGGLGGPWT